MKFYQGTDHKAVVKKAQKLAPSFDHRYGFTPDRMVGTVKHYFLDNGAFTQDFQEDKWVEMLERASGYEHEPDFIVLPDVFDDPEATWRKHQKYVSIVQSYGFDYYYVAQKGSRPGEIVEKALELEASGIFLGGSWHKPRILL